MERDRKRGMDPKEAEAIIKHFLGVSPDSPEIQEIIEERLVNNMYLLARALDPKIGEWVTEATAEIWEAVYALGIREKPGSSQQQST